jgi:CHAT domain-containing protein
LHEVEAAIAGSSSPSEELRARRATLLIERDRLRDTFLRDRSRASGAALPLLPELRDLESRLPRSTLYVAPVLVDDELYLLACRSSASARVVRALGSAREVLRQVEALRRCLDGQPERAHLDACLDDLGQGPLGDALWQVLDDAAAEPVRLVCVPEGELHCLPIHALRRGGRYLVERHDVVFTFSGALLHHHLAHPAGSRPFGPAVVVTEAPEVLPGAGREGACVAAAFWRSRRLAGPTAGREALRRCLRSARVVHLACHAIIDPEQPLSSRIVLPSGESLPGLDLLDEPLEGLPLVTLSACRSAEARPLVGREVFGLVTALLGSGVRAVVAGLWPVADSEVGPFMSRFYRHRLTCDVPAALARAQREALADPDGSPLFWAAFAFFGDPAALPAPRGLLRRLALWRQTRHARRFADSEHRHRMGA